MIKCSVILVVLTAILNTVLSSQLNEWNEFKNKIQVEQHNQLHENGTVPYEMSLNKFFDSPDVPGERIFGRFYDLKNNSKAIEIADDLVDAEDFDLPKEIDWRKKRAVTGVENQGNCNSCWAFASVGAIEGQYAIKTKKLVSFSAQCLVDCTNSNIENRCSGSMTKAFTYLVENGHKVAFKKDYKYTGKPQQCKEYKDGIGVKNFIQIDRGNESALKRAIATIGPIPVAIKVPKSFRLFKSKEIYGIKECKQIDDGSFWHAVLAVGYGTDKYANGGRGRDYYILKNSFGTNWGDQGYFKFVRNQKNACGIASRASYPILE